MLNLLNIVLYILIIVVSVQEKLNPTYVFKTVWDGVLYETAKKVN